ncbi:MAG: nucleotidyltransferase family protein [Planctomycetes bacterium]|nr:nucleotidyltransferase family protein [Planctomycetota bacterium]
MKCLLLGAGYATRLYPLTRERPKPLLPVGGIPILQRICNAVRRVPDVDRIYVVTNHRFVTHYYNWLREAGPTPVPIEIFDDLTTSNDDRLGAVGDIDFVVRSAKINDEMLVIAGDNLFEFDLKDFVKFAREHKGSAVAVKDVESKELAALYGVVDLDKNRRILDFEEKPPVPASTLIAIAIYYFAKDHVPLTRQYLAEGHNKDQPGHYIAWLHKQVPVYAYAFQSGWYDIGDIDSYNKANELYLAQEAANKKTTRRKGKK